MNPKQDTLEALIDSERLSGVLEHLAVVCAEKADHLRSNWQDDAGAKDWERAARALRRFATHAAVTIVSRY